jgi:hypothetical protein
MEPPPDPQTPQQWQEAVDAAEACVALDACRQYGLITGGPKIDVERCLQILARGRAMGIRPAKDCALRFVQAWSESRPNKPRRGGKE